MTEVLPAKMKLKLIVRRGSAPQGRWARLKWQLFPNKNWASPTRLVLHDEQVIMLQRVMQKYDMAFTAENITLACDCNFPEIVHLARGQWTGNRMFLEDHMDMSCRAARERIYDQELSSLLGGRL